MLILPSSPAHLTFAHMILCVLVAPIEGKNEVQWQKRKREKVRKYTESFYPLLSFFFLFFFFKIFFEGFVERVYEGRPPGVGVHPSSGGKREESEGD